MLPAVAAPHTWTRVPTVVRNPLIDAELVEALTAIWTRVSNDGGAVGFLPPVTEAEVRPLAESSLAAVADGRHDLVVALEDGGSVLGFGFLIPNTAEVIRHWATVRALQRDPVARGRAVGALVLDGLENAARARGLERVVLTVRPGQDREAFYARRGYSVDGRFRGRLRLRDGTELEEVHMSKSLMPGDEAGATLLVQRLDPGLPLPAYAHPGDAGLDLHAAADVVLAPGARAPVPTGLAVAVPEGCVGLVHPRSGLAARSGIAIVNAPGTVDAGYRGEVVVLLVNLDPREEVRIARGDRIAQLLVQRVERVSVTEVEVLPPSARGESGFGSTGR